MNSDTYELICQQLKQCLLPFECNDNTFRINYPVTMKLHFKLAMNRSQNKSDFSLKNTTNNWCQCWLYAIAAWIITKNDVGAVYGYLQMYKVGDSIIPLQLHFFLLLFEPNRSSVNPFSLYSSIDNSSKLNWKLTNAYLCCPLECYWPTILK